MKRPDSERTNRRSRIRLSLEHLEHRRLMAGLNVLVFNDQDGSRSLTPSVDAPASNRLVYVDLNRDFTFDEGEPLAVSGEDGFARFPGLAAGDYLIGLAANSAAQVLTTSVVPDGSARTLANAPGTPLTTLIASADLTHAWSATAGGVLTPVGSEDAGRPVVNLNGRLIASVAGADDTAWALVDHGQVQPTLYRLDFANGSARMTSVQGLSSGQRVVGLVRGGSSVFMQLTAGDANYVARIQAGSSSVSVGPRIAIPMGLVVSSPIQDRLAVLGSPSAGSGEDQQQGAKISVVQIKDTTASIESTQLESTLTNLTYSADGRYLFAVQTGGGVRVYTTESGLKSVADLAEATGPISASGDGRFVTANAARNNELIVWDAGTWSPAGRVQLPVGQGPVLSLAVDGFGERVIASTAEAALGARLANAAPQAVQVAAGTGITQAALGVRLVDRPAQLPERVSISRSTDEDVPLNFDLSTSDAVRALGSGLFFAQGAAAALGSWQVTPSGRVTYRSATNASGTDSATVRVFDGVSTTTLVVSLNVRPVNDAPSDLTVDVTPIAESAASGWLVGLATVMDVDTDARYEFTTSDSRFVVYDGQVMLSQDDALDYETESVINLEITASDLDNPAFVITRRISIPVTDSNDAPTSVRLAGSSTVPEDQSQATVGEVQVDDPD